MGPEIQPFNFPEEVEGVQLLQVMCTVIKGDDPVTIQWIKDGSPLQPSSLFMINEVSSRMSLLILSKVGSHHSGNYTCNAFNTVGQAMYSTELRVKGNQIENYKKNYIFY